MLLKMKLQKKYVLKFTNKKKERLKAVYIRAKGINKQFETKMNENVNGNRKLI